jgi:hypothetical protein
VSIAIAATGVLSFTPLHRHEQARHRSDQQDTCSKIKLIKLLSCTASWTIYLLVGPRKSQEYSDKPKYHGTKRAHFYTSSVLESHQITMLYTHIQKHHLEIPLISQEPSQYRPDTYTYAKCANEKSEEEGPSQQGHCLGNNRERSLHQTRCSTARDGPASDEHG